MNEILAKKLINKVKRYGVSEENAKDIVNHAIEFNKSGCDEALDFSIHYAIDLIYGLGFSAKISGRVKAKDSALNNVI